MVIHFAVTKEDLQKDSGFYAPEYGRTKQMIDDKRYTVVYAIDYMDPNPETRHFDCFDDAHDWIEQEMSRRLDFLVQHSPYTISKSGLDDLREIEYSLINLVDNNSTGQSLSDFL